MYDTFIGSAAALDRNVKKLTQKEKEVAHPAVSIPALFAAQVLEDHDFPKHRAAVDRTEKPAALQEAAVSGNLRHRDDGKRTQPVISCPQCTKVP
ncbi:MAG: hypothetical protein HFH94_06445 [Lachnospiraceae bacterium]|nr:hypothetical protein [Lachnospiraceae bacterium]